MMFHFPSVICTLCTGFFCLAIIKGPPNDIYFIIEGPYDGYFTEKGSQAQKRIRIFVFYNLPCLIWLMQSSAPESRFVT